jgi:hypothetical protein
MDYSMPISQLIFVNNMKKFLQSRTGALNFKVSQVSGKPGLNNNNG